MKSERFNSHTFYGAAAAEVSRTLGCNFGPSFSLTAIDGGRFFGGRAGKVQLIRIQLSEDIAIALLCNFVRWSSHFEVFSKGI